MAAQPVVLKVFGLLGGAVFLALGEELSAPRPALLWRGGADHDQSAQDMTTLLARGVCDIVTARDLAGHGSVSTTDIYLASTPDRLSPTGTCQLSGTLIRGRI